MKTLIALLVVVVLGAGAYWWLQRDTDTGVGDVEIMPTSSKPDPSNATFLFEDGPVTLKNGQASTNLFPDSEISTDTQISGEPVFGDINGDKKNDAVVLLVQNSGGSGVFVYVAAYLSGNIGYKGSNAVFVGDRISPQTLTISNTGVVTLNYLDRKPDEAMAATPTIPAEKTFVYRNSQLEER